MEVTTFHGHANVFGVTGPVDFQSVSAEPHGLDKVLAIVARAGGVVAINHPALPSGEACMGCGWSVPATDYRSIQAVEVINGGAVAITPGQADSPLSGIAFWQARLNEGYRLTAIGGSDNHLPAMDPARPGSVGSPTTVVWADNLSERAILDGVRAGHVFVDVEASHDRLIEVGALAGDQKAMMGDALTAPARANLIFALHGVHLGGDRWSVIEDGRMLPTLSGVFDGDNAATVFFLPSDGGRHWVRVEVRSPEGRLLLIANPIYLNFRP